MRYPPASPAFARRFYAVVRGAIAGFARFYWRLRVEGAERLPASGAFILAPVHRSNIDTPIMATLTRRYMRYLRKEEMWKYGWSAWLWDTLGAFPVQRDKVDRQALRKCEDALRAGEPLVVYAEGTRGTSPVIGNLFDGAAHLALRTGAPIFPVGIGGSARAMPRGAKFFRPVRVCVVVGGPLHPDVPEQGHRVSRRAVKELTDRLAKELQAVHDQARIQAGD
ncbi:MAG TPA: lysophospholipid acyltransferase family protein [Acidimicrobiales bacterium]|nr:lysophospholipid acyltransferase family protein [Acidimicrobiales bacterium]